MTQAFVNVSKTVHSRHYLGLLGLGLLFIVSAVSASVEPLPEAEQVQIAANLPRIYCLGNVASLGTGLVRAPFRSGGELSTQERRPWTGWIRASASGRYEFRLPNSGGRIFLNKQQIFSRSAMSSKPAIVQIELLTNRFYAITVETSDSKDPILSLQWRRPDGRHETVPKAYLYAPIATVGHSGIS